jgi:hypothetical protein
LPGLAQALASPADLSRVLTLSLVQSQVKRLERALVLREPALLDRSKPPNGMTELRPDPVTGEPLDGESGSGLERLPVSGGSIDESRRAERPRQ